MNRVVRKAVFPVAGLGTRFLPATKSIPKEILNLVDRPLIQYAIDEAREAGITEFIFVTSRGKCLTKKNKTALLDELKRTDMDSGAIAYVRQREALGLGHAVWCARRLIGDEPFAVILPDDVIEAKKPCLAQMVEAYGETGGNIVAAMEVPTEKTSSYGVLDVTSTERALMPVKGMVEKPEAGKAPSNMAVIGRYILTPQVLETLNGGLKGAGGEIQLTDAIAAQIGAFNNVYGYCFEGKRFDCGSKAGFLQATVAFGLSRPELGEEFLEYLQQTVALGKAAE